MLSLCMISNDQPVCLEMITLDHQCRPRSAVMSRMVAKLAICQSTALLFWGTGESEPVTLLAVMLIKVGDNDKIIYEYCLSARTATDVRCSLTISLIQQLRLDQSSKNNDEIQATQAG
eukprot:g79613.t1